MFNCDVTVTLSAAEAWLIGVRHALRKFPQKERRINFSNLTPPAGPEPKRNMNFERSFPPPGLLIYVSLVSSPTGSSPSSDYPCASPLCWWRRFCSRPSLWEWPLSCTSTSNTAGKSSPVKHKTLRFSRPARVSMDEVGKLLTSR